MLAVSFALSKKQPGNARCAAAFPGSLFASGVVQSSES
jgi:hypothetical protein